MLMISMGATLIARLNQDGTAQLTRFQEKLIVPQSAVTGSLLDSKNAMMMIFQMETDVALFAKLKQDTNAQILQVTAPQFVETPIWFLLSSVMTGFPLIIKDALVIAQVLLQDGAVIQLEEVYHDEIYK